MSEVRLTKYFCSHCSKPVEEGQEVTSILSGSAGCLSMKNGEIDGNVNNIQGAIVFHDECFLELAGLEYYPRKKGDD